MVVLQKPDFEKGDYVVSSGTCLRLHKLGFSYRPAAGMLGTKLQISWGRKHRRHQSITRLLSGTVLQ